MNEPKREVRPGSTDGAPAVAFEIVKEITAPSGRHKIRLINASAEQVAMGIVVLILVGFPFAFFIGLIPIWDRIGDFVLVRQLNHYVAPVLESLPHERLPHFPGWRAMIASISIVELLFLTNLIALFSRRFRKQALLVWIYYSREKTLFCFMISGVVFFALWYLLFYDWGVLEYAFSHYSRRAARLMVYGALSLPFSALLFGYMAAVVGLGLWRDVLHERRRRVLGRISQTNGTRVE